MASACAKLQSALNTSAEGVERACSACSLEALPSPYTTQPPPPPPRAYPLPVTIDVPACVLYQMMPASSGGVLTPHFMTNQSKYTLFLTKAGPTRLDLISPNHTTVNCWGGVVGGNKEPYSWATTSRSTPAHKIGANWSHLFLPRLPPGSSAVCELHTSPGKRIAC